MCEQLQPEELEQQRQDIVDFGLVRIGGKHAVQCLSIIGQIEGHYLLPANNKTTKYEHILPQLVAMEEDDGVEGLLILLNTIGGDVEAGLAIAELIAGMAKPTVSLVLGGGHSIGVPLAVSAKTSFIVPSATMTVHPVRTTGTVVGVRQSFAHFEKMQQRIVRFISDHSRITAARLNQLMMTVGDQALDMGVILSGDQAVEEGLIDRVGSLQDALKELYQLIEAAAPPKQES
ncbi:MAG TPA: ATP-dependent Clp protease proteolytic subunit [Candidatus Egerieicola faecale]|uniref:ATP-dependent Clp protease proteolytic subunit n=1 Tax=Candidatus Egerieicola faecale TaxID=2840774 RepID=A0A9D1LJQ5_9FIRM|nr:ATP-dependent Clp protease proteolytic subunit [Candidatus Egerieicola faecale]